MDYHILFAAAIDPSQSNRCYFCYKHQKCTQFKKNIYLLSSFDFIPVGHKPGHCPATIAYKHMPILFVISNLNA